MSCRCEESHSSPGTCNYCVGLEQPEADRAARMDEAWRKTMLWANWLNQTRSQALHIAQEIHTWVMALVSTIDPDLKALLKAMAEAETKKQALPPRGRSS